MVGMESGSPVVRGFGPRIQIFIMLTPKGERARWASNRWRNSDKMGVEAMQASRDAGRSAKQTADAPPVRFSARAAVPAARDQPRRGNGAGVVAGRRPAGAQSLSPAGFDLRRQ